MILPSKNFNYISSNMFFTVSDLRQSDDGFAPCEHVSRLISFDIDASCNHLITKIAHSLRISVNSLCPDHGELVILYLGTYTHLNNTTSEMCGVQQQLSRSKGPMNIVLSDTTSFQFCFKLVKNTKINGSEQGFTAWGVLAVTERPTFTDQSGYINTSCDCL